LAELYPSKSIRIAAIEQRFLELADGGINQQAPARFLEARSWLIRAKREHAGGLLVDAESSAARAEAILDDLRQTVFHTKAIPRAAR
jgi:hypothetical protein